MDRADAEAYAESFTETLPPGMQVLLNDLAVDVAAFLTGYLDSELKGYPRAAAALERARQDWSQGRVAECDFDPCTECDGTPPDCEVCHGTGERPTFTF